MIARRQHIPLILCCADDGEVALVGVLDELHRKGLAPEVLMGVDADAATLTHAVDRLRGPALFVLCQTEELGRSDVRRLSGLFSARRGPSHQLLTVQIEAGNELSVLPSIEAALDEAEAAGGASMGEDDGYHMRDVIGPTGVSALPRDAGPGPRRSAAAASESTRGIQPSAAERIAKELHDEMVQAEAVLARRQSHRPTAGAAARARQPAPRQATRPAVARPQPQRPAPTPRRGPLHTPRAAAAPSLDMPAEELIEANTEPLDPVAHTLPDVDEGVPRVIENDRAMAGDSPTPRRPRVLVEEEVVAAERSKDARRERDDTPLYGETEALRRAARDQAMAEEVLERTDRMEPPLPGPDVLGAGRPAPSQSRPMGRLLLLVSGAGMLALVGMAVMSLTDDGAATPSAGRGSPTTKAGAGPDNGAGKADGGALVAKTSNGNGDGEPNADGGAAAGDDGAGKVDDGAAVADDGDAADDDEGDDADDDGEDDGAGAGHTTPPAPPASDLPPAVAQAVADGRIKQHGKILFIPAPKETMTWDEADRRCRLRKIAGLGGWRLPTKGDLSRLRRGGFVTSGSYWTRQTEGDDEVYAFDAKSSRSSLWLKVEPNGRSLCSRRKP